MQRESCRGGEGARRDQRKPRDGVFGVHTGVVKVGGRLSVEGGKSKHNTKERVWGIKPQPHPSKKGVEVKT